MGPILYLISNKATERNRLLAIEHELSITPLSVLVVLSPNDIPLAKQLAGYVFLSQHSLSQAIDELKSIAIEQEQAIGIVAKFTNDLTALYEDGKQEILC